MMYFIAAKLKFDYPLYWFPVKKSQKFPIGRVDLFCQENVPDKQTSGS